MFVPKYGIEGPVFLTPKAGGAGDKAGAKDKAGAAAAAPPEDPSAQFILDEEAQTVTSK